MVRLCAMKKKFMIHIEKNVVIYNVDMETLTLKMDGVYEKAIPWVPKLHSSASAHRKQEKNNTY
jgi:hypothetical protein